MKLRESVQPECSQGSFPMENNTFLLEYNGQFCLKTYLRSSCTGTAVCTEISLMEKASLKTHNLATDFKHSISVELPVEAASEGQYLHRKWCHSCYTFQRRVFFKKSDSFLSRLELCTFKHHSRSLNGKLPVSI